MNSDKSALRSIPTNIITGFLGAGKTTAILHLLKSKPATERWAVLVNEFGKVGIDGSLFKGQHSKTSGIFIREVPGGCMCCTAGLPMQVALNELLLRAKPSRLLLETSGLGHPRGVLEVLSSDYYQDVLNIQQCITLVDARKLSDPRYTQNDTFNQQIDMADVIVGNKRDLYKGGESAHLSSYVANRSGRGMTVMFCQQGKINPSILEGTSAVAEDTKWSNHHHHHSSLPLETEEQALPACGFLKAEHASKTYRSVGWRISPEYVFCRNKLFSWLDSLKAERMKALFITDQGIFGYNLTSDALNEFELNDCSENTIEILTEADQSMPEFNWQTFLVDPYSS